MTKLPENLAKVRDEQAKRYSENHKHLSTEKHFRDGWESAALEYEVLLSARDAEIAKLEAQIESMKMSAFILDQVEKIADGRGEVTKQQIENCQRSAQAIAQMAMRKAKP